VKAHLENCGRCQKLWNRLGAGPARSTPVCSGSDCSPPADPPTPTTFWPLPGDLGGQPSSPSSTPELAKDATPSSAVGSPANPYDILGPARGPDEIGWLGPYRILKVLGQGGMGVVFQAEDPQLQRLVALKVMLPGLGSGEEARARFLREARIVAAIEHDNIVPIFQVGEDQGVPFLAMQLLRGETLDERLRRVGRIPLGEVLRIAREVAQGLAAAHQRGLIHRDVKPANIWLESETDRVKILDFGLAGPVGAALTPPPDCPEPAAAPRGVFSRLTDAGAIFGTPAYMAPEQAGGQAVSPSCDLFGLGCVLYLLATGTLPFKGKDTFSLLEAVANNDPAKPREVNADLPPELSDLIMHLLAKSPAQRPATAQAVIKQLDRIQQSLGPSRTNRQRRWGVALIVAGLVTAGGLTALLLSRNHQGMMEDNLSDCVYSAGEAALLPRNHEGTVEIKTDDPRIRVLVADADGKVTAIYPKERKEILLKAGVYRVSLGRGGEALALDAETFTLTGGERRTIIVRQGIAPPKPRPSPGPEESEDVLVRKHAVIRLMEKGADSFPILLELLYLEQDKDLRNLLFTGLIDKYSAKDMCTAILKTIKDPSADTYRCQVACFFLSNLYFNQRVEPFRGDIREALQFALLDVDEDVQAAAARALETIDNVKQVPLESKRKAVLLSLDLRALEALGMKPEDVVQVIQKRHPKFNAKLADVGVLEVVVSEVDRVILTERLRLSGNRFLLKDVLSKQPPRSPGKENRQ
jgi:serine/threonine protein kinase